MKGDQKFFLCKHCGNMAGLIRNQGVPMVCCGEKMAELIPNTADAAVEKHKPVVTVLDDGIAVEVGGAAHPMEDAHNIAFVYVETVQGGQRKCLKAGDKPKAEFRFCGDKPIAVYAYCNLHGLWKTEV